MAAETPDAWIERPRRDPDRALRIAMALATAAIVFLLAPFAYALGAAAVTVAATWPLHRRVLRLVGQRTWVAAGVSTTTIALLALVPLGIVATVFVGEAAALAGQVADAMESGALSEWVGWVADDERAGSARISAWLAPLVEPLLPGDVELGPIVAGPVREGAIALLREAAASVPGLVHATLRAVVGVLIYVATTAVLYVEGPSLVRLANDLSPLEPRYQKRLVALFVQISRNLVVGTFAVAAIQGMVAGIGYALFGVDRVVFFAVVTAVFALVPFVGTSLVWIPIAVYTGVHDGAAPAIGLAVWSSVATTQIDNLVRPFFTRGSLQVHPLLVGLAAFGGLQWFGIPGALLGPFVAALFAALYAICADAFCGDASEGDRRTP